MKMLLLLPPTLLFPILALVGCANPSTATDQPTPASAPPVSAVTPSPAVRPEPRSLLKQMAVYLQSLDRFKVRVEKTTELILPTEQRLHADKTVEIAVQKPNRLRADFQNLSGGRQLFYDGKTFALYTPEPIVYAIAPAPATIDETLAVLEDQYRISMPVADLLMANPHSRLARNLESAIHVGRILVRGVACHHLAFRTLEVDWEIWIEDGPRPLPRRLLLTDKSVEGSPQMTASLSDWDVAPQFAPDFFIFKPPQNAQRIQFLSEQAAIRPTAAGQ